MALLEGMLRAWQRSTCKHRWVRARWPDGRYGLRCGECMQAYPHTWEEVIGNPPAAPATAASAPATAGLSELHRPA